MTVGAASASTSAITWHSFPQMQETQRTLAADPTNLDVAAEFDVLRMQASLLVGIYVPFCHEGMIAGWPSECGVTCPAAICFASTSKLIAMRAACAFQGSAFYPGLP